MSAARKKEARHRIASMALAVVAGTLAWSAAPAQAKVDDATRAGAFVTPSTWTRGTTPNSTYVLWDNSFTSLTSNSAIWDGPGGAADEATANIKTLFTSPSLSGFDIASTIGTNLITGTGRVYGNATSNIGLSATIPNYGLGSSYTTEFHVQANTSIIALDPASFAISADGGASTPVTPVVTTLTGTAGQFDRLYTFSVPGNASSYQLTFASPTSGTNYQHVTLAAFSVDTVAAVPEPTSLGALALGAVALMARRRRSASSL